MKKYISVLLLSIGLMAMQSASAATLSLGSGTGGVTIDPPPPLTGTWNGSGSVTLSITTAANEVVDLLFSFTTASQNFTHSFSGPTTGLTSGDYILGLNGGSGSYSINFTSQISEVPVPAAVWLFGSALMGLFGVRRSKSTPAIAA
ncbi:hypothetical protein MCAMS1_01258 [biofilm metagenome]